MNRFEIQIASRVRGIPAPAAFRRWLGAALGRRAGAVTLRVVNSAEARVLNRDYRARDYATNVLTFAYATRPVSADIVLCAQVVAREAREQGKRLADHYAHLTVHGALHAMGLDHETPADARVMEAREVRILGTLDIDDPYRIVDERA